MLPPKDQRVSEPDVFVEFTVKLSKPNAVTKWYKDGKIIVPRKDKYELIETKETVKLVVYHVDGKDAGEYTIEVDGGQKATAKLAVESKHEFIVIFYFITYLCFQFLQRSVCLIN